MGRGSGSGSSGGGKGRTYPNLTGSEKQVAWANDIRQKAINTAGANIEAANRRLAEVRGFKDEEVKNRGIARQNAAIMANNVALDGLTRTTSASFFINNRESMNSLLKEAYKSVASSLSGKDKTTFAKYYDTVTGYKKNIETATGSLFS